MSEANKPVQKYKAGSIEVAIWEQKSDKGTWYSISLKRNYKDKDGKWAETSSLRVNDIPKLQLCLNKAYDYTVDKTKDE